MMFLHALLYIICFKTASKYGDNTLEEIDFGCFSIVICDNTAALPCKGYC